MRARFARSSTWLIEWLSARPAQVTFAVLLVFAAVSLVLAQHPGPSDEGGYMAYADALVSGRYWSSPARGQMLWWGPGLPILLAPFSAIGAPMTLVRLVFGPAFLAGTVYALWRALMFDAGARAATLGALALALYLPAWVHLGEVLSEPATTLALTISLLCWVRARVTKSRWLAIGAGVSLGTAALIRVEFGYVILVALVVSAAWSLHVRRSTPRLAVLASMVALGTCLPWLAYTYHESGRVLYWGTSGGLSLYWVAAAKPPQQGDWFKADDALRDPRFKPYWRDLGRAESRDPVAADVLLQSFAAREVRDHPGRYLQNIGKNLARLIVNFPYSFTPVRLSLVFYGVPNLLLLVTATILAATLTRRRLWHLVAIAPVFVVLVDLILHLPLSAEPRFFTPLVPIFLWFICKASVVLQRRSPGLDHARLSGVRP